MQEGQIGRWQHCVMKRAFVSWPFAKNEEEVGVGDFNGGRDDEQARQRVVVLSMRPPGAISCG